MPRPQRFGCAFLSALVLSACARTPPPSPAMASTPPSPDQAQAAVPSVWPASHAGVLFAFRDPRDIIAFDEDGSRKKSYHTVPSDFRATGFTYSERSGGLVLVRGSYKALGIAPFLAKRLKDAPSVTIEAFVTPARAPAGAGVIAALSGAAGSDVALVQTGDVLALEIRATPPVRVELGPAGTRPVHLLATCAGGRVRVYRDGVAVADQDGPRMPDQEFRTVWVGGEYGESRPWSGIVHAVALYDIAADAALAVAHHRTLSARLATRTAANVPRSTIEATLVERSKVPNPRQIKPYYRALTVCSYRVNRVLDGPALPEFIQVAHWGVMADRQLAIRDAQPGVVHTLVLEPFAEHDYLTSEFTTNTLEAHADTPLFFDVSAWSLRTALATEVKP